MGEKFFPNRGDTKIRENVLRIFGLKRDTRTHPTGHFRPAIIRVITALSGDRPVPAVIVGIHEESGGRPVDLERISNLVGKYHNSV